MESEAKSEHFKLISVDRFLLVSTSVAPFFALNMPPLCILPMFYRNLEGLVDNFELPPFFNSSASYSRISLEFLFECSYSLMLSGTSCS